MLDVLRTIAVESRASRTRLLLTTANTHLVRHIREKFALVKDAGGKSLLRVYRLLGEPRSGVRAELVRESLT
jgi:hypothetical protein